jgi:hypothetical protein
MLIFYSLAVLFFTCAAVIIVIIALINIPLKAAVRAGVCEDRYWLEYINVNLLFMRVALLAFNKAGRLKVNAARAHRFDVSHTRYKPFFIAVVANAFVRCG